MWNGKVFCPVHQGRLSDIYYDKHNTSGETILNNSLMTSYTLNKPPKLSATLFSPSRCNGQQVPSSSSLEEQGVCWPAFTSLLVVSVYVCIFTEKRQTSLLPSATTRRRSWPTPSSWTIPTGMSPSRTTGSQCSGNLTKKSPAQ